MKLKAILKVWLPMMVSVLLLVQSCVKESKSNRLSDKELMTDAEELGLRAQVKSIKTLYFDAAGDKENVQKLGKSDGEQDAFFRLDKRGQKLQEDWLDNEGNLIFGITYNQDSSGRRVEKLMRYADSDGETRDSLRYNEVGRLVGVDHYDDENILTKTVFRFNEKGLKQEQIDYDASGDVDRKTEYDYNEKGQRTEERHFNSEGEQVVRRLFTYESDDIAEIKEFDKNDKLLSRVEIAYNKEGLKTEENVFGVRGDNIRENTYSYELDDRQNWIKQTVFESQKPIMIVEREIKYY